MIDPDEAQRASPNRDGLRSQIIRGAYWKASGSVGITILSFAAQIILGFLLSEEDFGTYALAIATANLVKIFRDGGSRWFATQLTPANLSASQHSLSRYSLAAALVVTPLVVATGIVGSNLYEDPRILHLVAILAAAIPLGFYAPIGFACLHVQMKFKEATTIEIISAALRQTGIVVLALLGFGPYSFVLPVIVVNAFESLWTWFLTRPTPLVNSESGTRLDFRNLLLSSGGNWLNFFYRNVDYLILGALLPIGTVGFYFFAYEIVARLTGWVDSIRGVAVPAFAQRGVEPVAFGKALSVSVTLGSLLAMGAILSADAALSIVWGDRWAGSIGAVIAFASTIPFFLGLRIFEMAAMGAGRFGLWSVQVAIRIIAVAGAALWGGLMAGASATTPAALVASGVILASYLVMALSETQLDIRSPRLFRAMVVSTPLFIGTSLAARWVLDQLGLTPIVDLSVGLGVAACIAFAFLRLDVEARRLIRQLIPRWGTQMGGAT